MTLREMNLAVFARESVPHVLFQPRFEPWFHWHQIMGTHADRYREMSVRDLYDETGASMRYVHYYTGMDDPIRRSWAPEARRQREENGHRAVTTWQTPHGELRQVEEFTVDRTWRTVDFAVKHLDDFRKLTWLLEHARIDFDGEAYGRGEQYIGDRGVGQFWVPKSPYQSLAQEWSTLDTLVYALADAPDVVEETMRAINAAYDPLFEQLTGSSDIKILNFGENLHEQLLSPRYFEEYFLPYYHRRAGQLREAGIFTHVHIDGYWKGMLPRLRDLPFDGIEALTPTPQGDMELDQIKEHIGDKILLDGIPAVLFMPTYSIDQLMECVERLVNLFAPNLILGVSDEVPEGAGEDAIERLRLVSEWCARTPHRPRTTKRRKTSREPL